MAVALESVVKQLTDSGIIAQGQLENFIPPKAQPKDTEELIAQLVKENHLTKFQAAQVANGRAKSLILGEYTILDKIGAGGMGQVFKALHRRMDRLVAIKTLPAATMKDAAAVARFEREVKAAAKLRHAHVVAADDAGQANGIHFLVMEYVEGQDLSALVKKNGPFPVAKATNYILQTARGLEFAHKKGVVHRDIKPANLLLDSEGVVKILDMGLARIESEGNAATQAELTGTGAIMGTVDYMAPEQGMSTKHADARADIYSLGCSLYYLIAGKATYDGETMAAKLVAHHTHPIPDLRTAHADVTDDLDAVFKKMVAKKIEDRYQTMTEVIADLERLGGGQQTSMSIGQSASTNFENSALTFLKNQPIQRTIQKTKATKQVAAVKSSDGKQPPWKNTKVLIGAGAAGFLCLLLGVIVIVRNKDGKEVARLEVADGHSVEVQPTTPTPARNVLQPTLNADRSLAELALSKKWGFTISVGDKINAGPHQQLPKEPFSVTALTTYGILLDSDLAAISAAESLDSLNFLGGGDSHQLNDSKVIDMGTYKSFNKLRLLKISGSTITDAVVDVIERMPSLRILHVTRTSISNKGIERLSRLPLTGFAIGSDFLTNEVFDRFGPMPLLTNLVVETGTGSLLTDDAFKLLSSRVQASNKLDRLDLIGAKITDNTIANFRSFSQLRFLYLANSAVSQNGIASFQKALPKCLISSDLKQYADSTLKPSTIGPAPPLAVAPFDAQQAKAHQEAWAKHLGMEIETTNSVGMKMILIPPGEFMMGSTDEQVAAVLKVADEINDNQVPKDQIPKAERPQHRVVITKPFLIGATEVTVGQFKKFAAATGYQTEAEKEELKAKASSPPAITPGQPPTAPSPILTYLNSGYAVTDDSPVAVITWNDAVAFCQWLSTKEKTTYRLPTEAEWEYACRAGTTTQYSFGDDHQQLEQYGWYKKNAVSRSHEVGTKMPNGFGLFDMHGNMWEWCHDFWDEKWYEKNPSNDANGPVSGSDRVLRGASKSDHAVGCRSAYRHNHSPLARTNTIGFRIVRELAVPATTASVTPQPAVPAAASGKLFMHDPAFQQWMKDVQAMPAEEQIEAVSKKLMELNPGFDGKVTDWFGKNAPKIENGVVTGIAFNTDHVADISPVKALVGLSGLNCSSSGRGKSVLSDLSALRGMKLTYLECGGTQVSDLTPLQGMPLTMFSCTATPLSDLSPLRGMPLEGLNFAASPVSDLSPLEGMSLLWMDCPESQVSDLSPLKGMPLGRLVCYSTKVSDLTPLQDCKSLATLRIGNTQVTAAAVAVLREKLPKCKIEWSEPSKPSTPEPPVVKPPLVKPAASGTK